MGGGAHPQGRGTGGGRIALGEYTPPNARLPGCTGCGDRGRRGGQRDPHLASPEAVFVAANSVNPRLTSLSLRPVSERCDRGRCSQ